jgi:ATP-dependent RNA helicase RhlE
VHRIGRTGRAGQSGLAVSLVSDEDEKLLRDIERLIKRRVTRRDFEVASLPAKPAEAPRTAQASEQAGERRESGAGHRRRGGERTRSQAPERNSAPRQARPERQGQGAPQQQSRQGGAQARRQGPGEAASGQQRSRHGGTRGNAHGNTHANTHGNTHGNAANGKRMNTGKPAFKEVNGNVAEPRQQGGGRSQPRPARGASRGMAPPPRSANQRQHGNQNSGGLWESLRGFFSK